VLSGNREAMAKLPIRDLEKILAATLTGMSVEEFNAEARKWLETARDPRWKRSFTELVYQPMLEVLRYLRDNGYKTYIVTGGGQDFVRVYAQQVYGIPPEQVVGTAGGTKFGYAKDGKPFLTKEPKLLLNNDNAGKPEGIHLMIGRRPNAAFGNSVGDRQMLEWTAAGAGARLKMLVLHDDAAREYAYGPATGLPASRVGTFTPALYDEAKKKGWTVISMKNDWKRIFTFEQ
jgi:haloacid dehalogenase-like hydrolase